MSRFASSAFRVQNLATSVNYYSKHFQFKTAPVSAKECLLSFDGKGATLLLTEADGELSLGTGYGHIALIAQDLYGVCDRIKQEGGNLTREPGPVKGGTTEIAFVEAPGGAKIELIKRPDDWHSPFLHVMVRVVNLEATTKFYEALGMQLLKESANEAYKYTLQFMGFDKEEESTVFEFTYNWGQNDYQHGNVYESSTLVLQNIEEAYKLVQQNGTGKIVKELSEADGTKSFTCTDPDGYLLICNSK